jgi:hypothetical protein
MSAPHYVVLEESGDIVIYAVKTRDGWRIYKTLRVKREKVAA